jgi:hypothetical protein
VGGKDRQIYDCAYHEKCREDDAELFKLAKTEKLTDDIAPRATLGERAENHTNNK